MKYYWKTKEGKFIDVDEMSENHLRNALKFLMRHPQKKPQYRREMTVKLEGEMAQEFNDMMDDEAEAYRDYDNEIYNNHKTEHYGL